MRTLPIHPPSLETNGSPTPEPHWGQLQDGIHPPFLGRDWFYPRGQLGLLPTGFPHAHSMPEFGGIPRLSLYSYGRQGVQFYVGRTSQIGCHALSRKETLVQVPKGPLSWSPRGMILQEGP